MDSEQSQHVSADEILDGIWLGNEASSQDISFLDRNNISIVINCTKRVSFTKYRHIRRKYRLNVNNPGPGYDLREKNINYMAKELPTITEVIHYWSLRKQKILIHCHSGVQRSAAVVVAYIMRYYNKTYLKSCKHVLNRRPQSFYGGKHVNFRHALLYFQSSSYCRKSS